MLCCLCLLESPNIMDIFDDLGEKLKVAEVINEHFWFKPQPNDILTSQICTLCWNKIDDFHTFYKTVEKAHKDFQSSMAIKEENKISFNSIKEETFEDDKSLEVNLMQLEVEMVEGLNKYKNDDIIELKNPLWNEQNDSDSDGKSDFGSEDDMDNDEEKAENEENKEVRQTRAKRKTKNTKTDQNEDCTKKKRKSNFDPILLKEMVKKYIPMVCNLCDFAGETFSDIKTHFKDQHSNVQPYIMCCNKKIDREYVIKEHAARHENPDCFRCIDCNKSFTTSKGLRTHNIEFHAPDEQKNHTCEYCSRKFQRKNLLELHRQSHIPKEQWNITCTKCTTGTTKFASQYLLNIHISMFHNRKINVCHVCSKEIKDKKAFEKHVRLHFEESGPRIKCPVPECDRWLKDEDNVKHHIQRYHKLHKWSEYREAITSQKDEDEKIIDFNLMQIDEEQQQDNKKSIDLKNPLENIKNNNECNEESEKSDEYEPSDNSDNDSYNDEEDILNDEKLENLNQKTTKKQKTSTKSEKNKDSTKKKRTWKRFDPKLAEEMMKKHIRMACHLCIFVGNTFQDIKDHFKDHHPTEKPYIMCCDRKFTRAHVIAQHAAIHEDPNYFKCNECNRSFTTTKGLRTHFMEHHAPDEEKIHACEHCPRKFQRKNLLEHHRPKHIPKEQWTFNCTKCTTRKSLFASQYLLNIHNSMFHRKEINICHVCAKEIKDKKAFEKHVRYHFEDSGPRLKCPLPDCNRWLKDEDNLKTHMQLHNLSGKIYKCPECGKDCSNRRALAAHRRFVHSKEIFRCEVCDKTFKKALGLKEHMAQHTGETLYTCPFCPRTFNSNANMHSHKKKQHPFEWEELKRKKIGNLPSL